MPECGAGTADGSACKCFHRAGRDGIDADALGAKIIGEVAHGGFECGFGNAHDVVIRRHTVGAGIGERQQGAAVWHQFGGATRHVDERKAGHGEGIGEVGKAGVDEAACQFVLVGKGDGVDEEIYRAPVIFQLFKAGIHRIRVHHIDIDHEGRTERGGKRFDPFAKGFALVGKCEFGPFGGHGRGNAPSNGTFVRNTHYQAAFALHQIGHSGSPPVLFS